ncbi:hypothetical protein [Pseudescherichia sp.]|nr:hypothetical protein [Pseudescherichia sp.]
MKHSILEVVTHAENAMSYNSQALPVQRFLKEFSFVSEVSE